MKDLKRIDLNLLVALDVLLEERSVTRAADRLALTQPTVSAMLARLRDLFDDPLFVRAQRGLLPTPRSEALAPSLKEWLVEAHGLVAGESFNPATARFTASISANDYIQSALLVPLVRRLRREAPNVRLAVRSAELCHGTMPFENGAIDLCIATTSEIPSRDLTSRPLYNEHYTCIVRKGHPLASARITLDQFCRFPHVAVSPTESQFTEPVDQALAQFGRKRQVVLSIPEFLILPEILATDDLIAVVPERVVRGRMSGLRTFAPPVAVPEFSVVALWHQRVHTDPAHRWLRGLVAETAREFEQPERRCA
ncbi:LysR family transcriptional regulator [Dongia deserti]|uniref:LysR family transcriptional regulator n=1 Tax=Dongia deserti TaxID=2268030 RepID=UPI002548F2BD|nr:LysR family transcriptional regulator [Dongia deserti]